MLISDLIRFVAGIANMKIEPLIFILIITLIIGFLTHKIVGSIGNHIAFVVINLLIFLTWVEAWQNSEYMWVIGLAASLVVSGADGYRRLNR